MVNPRLIPGPTVLVLFGATGDLAHRLVLPSLFSLAKEGLLPKDWRLIGNGRGDVAHEDFRERVRQSLEEFGPKPSEGPWDEFSSRLLFAGGGFDAHDPGCLLDVIAEAEKELAPSGPGSSTRSRLGRRSSPFTNSTGQLTTSSKRTRSIESTISLGKRRLRT